SVAGAQAQQPAGAVPGGADRTRTTAEAAPADTSAAGRVPAISTQPPLGIQYIRPVDQRGINMFESPKRAGATYTGFKLDWSAAFTQQFQALEHSNSAAERIVNDATGNPYNANQLLDIGWGFNLATANIGINAQLAPGVRVALESYMSSRHHNEFWVKGGYLQIDESPIDLPVLHAIMEYVTIKAGMFELNYGDAHFRRSDNGNAMFNPFVENNILDSFNTEIGAEIYFRTGPWLAMAGVTDGVNKGGVNVPDQRGPAFLGKVGFDQQLSPDLRVRLTGSLYTVDKTPSNNLYNGDRTGSRYYSVMENTVSTLSGNFTSGRLNPGFTNQITAFQINPFVRLGGLELFGVVERAEGKNRAEDDTRTWTQYAGEAVYRFLPREQLYIGGRYNTAFGKLRNVPDEASVDRIAVASGWFLTPSILVKAEYVNQKYNDFPAADIRRGGKFDGFMVEGVIAF
ncbi:MAG: hypothetical protein ACRELT_16120, partial [Longimicrobiales bacterium]